MEELPFWKENFFPQDHFQAKKAWLTTKSVLIAAKHFRRYFI